MSTSVGTMRAGSKLPGPKEKPVKGDKITAPQQTPSVKLDSQSNKMQPTQEQLRFAEMMSTTKTDADPKIVKQLMDTFGKSEDVVVIALHDSENDVERAAVMLLEGGNEQGEWLEQGGKKKKKGSQKESNEDQQEGHVKERSGDKSGDSHEMPPRRGRRNGGPPPRLARGRGRDRANFGDRDKGNFGDRDKANFVDREKGRNSPMEDWDNEKEDRGSLSRVDRDRNGGDRGRSRGRGGFGARKPGNPLTSGRGRFSNSNDRENRGFSRPRRFEKVNHTPPLDGPEIDTWTNETAENNITNKDTDWNSWNDSWVNEEDQWTGTLDETTVFTPSHAKMPEPDIVNNNEPPSSLGQRLDVGSLFENAKFTKAPDYSKPTGDSYITQFNQAATESIKNTIGIGSTTRQIGMTSSQNSSSSLGLTNLGQNSVQVQGSLSPIQQSGSQKSIPNNMAQLSQIQQTAPPSASQIGIVSQPNQSISIQAPQQSRIPAVMQQQQGLSQTSVNNLQQRNKPQRSKLPPPSKIPSTAVEMPGHIPRNPQLDVQFGLDFGSEPSVQFGFGGSGDGAAVTSSFSASSNGTTVISNHLTQDHVSPSAGDGNVSSIIPSPSINSNKHPSGIDTSQVSTRQGAFHGTIYSSSQPKNESQIIDRDQNQGNESIPFLSSQLERKSGPIIQQHTGQTNQNLVSGAVTSNKNDSTSAAANNSYSSTNGYTSYPSHPKGSVSHSTVSQPPQTSSFPGQYPVQSYPSGQTQYHTPPNSTPFPSAQPPQFNSNSSQNQYSSQNQFSSGQSTLAHQSQFPQTLHNSYGNGPSQYSGYQNTSSFPSHVQSQPNYPSNQTGSTGTPLYPTTTQQSSVPMYTSQSNSYQSPSSGSYHSSREGQNTTQSSTGMAFSSQTQSSNLKSATTQSSSSYNSTHYNAAPTPLQQSSLVNKLGEGLSKISIKDSSNVLDTHQSSQFEHTPSAASSVPTNVSLQSASSSASLSTGTNTISSTSTVTSVSSASRVASMSSTSGKAPPNLPPGVPLMGQYIMGQSTIPPFYVNSVQTPLYGYEDVQLLQQRMPMQSGSFYDMSAFPAPTGSTLPTGRDQQPPIPSVPFSGSSDTKLTRVDAQSPNASSQPQSAHSAAQQPLFNFYYGYHHYPSMFHGAAGLQYPTTVYPIPPVTNAAPHPGTTATTQFQKSYPSHVYTTKGYDEVNQVQDFSKAGYGSSQSSGKSSGTRSGTNEITPNAYSKSHGQGFDKQGFHGGTPPPFNLPLAAANQTGQMGGPTTPYGAQFLPVMAAHQPHSQMMHHPIQQCSPLSPFPPGFQQQQFSRSESSSRSRQIWNC